MYPLTPMQQGMLFHTLYLPEKTAYVEQMSCTVSGEFDIVAFEKAWQSALNRHPILRSSFVGRGLREPVQVVHSAVNVRIRTLDYRNLDERERRNRISELRIDEYSRGFDLSAPPLMRWTLARIADRSFHFTWTYHHILLDGWSVPMLLEEVFTLHEAYRNGKTPDLPPRRSFRDYIVWLRKQDMAAAERFWRATLEGFSAPTSLSMFQHHDGESVGEPRSIAEEILIPRDTTSGLISLTRNHQVTLNTVIQGIWAFLLSRYTGVEDVLFGATVSGRPAELIGADAMLGLFINTLPVRTRVPRGMPFIQWLGALQDSQAEMRQFEFTPLVDIQRWSEVKGGTQLFESILVFENYPMEAALGGLTGTLEVSEIETREITNYPLALVGGPGEELLIRIAYDADLFQAETMRGVLHHFQTVCQQLVRQPGAPCSEFSLLSTKEREEIVVRWTTPHVEGPATELFVHELFERKAQECPDAIALAFRGETMTYREVNRRANRIAHRLRRLGVGPEVIVGLCLEVSFDMVVTTLGVLKAGGAYLPLDPAYPVERLRYMMDDAHIALLIAEEPLFSDDATETCRILTVEECIEEVSAGDEDPPRTAYPGTLAYVIYTSGSTGRPKGSLLTQAGFANIVNVCLSEFAVTEQSRVLNFFSFAFDGSITTIFTALTSGGTLVLVEREELMSPAALRRTIQEQRISHLLATPSILSVTPSDGLRSIRAIIAGGEVCPWEVARSWSQGRLFINAYGPTETTVASTHYAYRGEGNHTAVVPIGRPLNNVRVYILDRFLNPVPVGIQGEIFVGGAGVGRGYLDRVSMTAEKFLPDPFCGVSGTRMYRTGDRGRFLRDGNIEFLGRLDDQVKIRGFRIELGEIETVLKHIDGVLNAHVIAREDTPGDRRVVAYVVPDQSAGLTPEGLLSDLRRLLPSYMVPSAVVLLESLPLLPSGKVNRQALPAPGFVQTTERHKVTSPRNATETKLTQLWEDILQTSPIGIDDDFFALGGHSFLAIRLLAQMQQTFGKEIPMVSLFQNPTVRRLAEVIQAEEDEGASESIVELRRGDSSQALFFVHPTGGSVHWYADLAKCLDGDHAVYGIQARGLNGKQPLDTTIEQMASRYVQEILRIQPEGPYFVSGWSLGVIIAYAVAWELMAEGRPVGMLAVLDQGPAIPVQREPADDAELLSDIFSRSFPLDVSYLRQLDVDEQYKVALRKAKKAGLVPYLVSLQSFRQYILINKTQSHAWREYIPKPYPGRIWVVRSEEWASGDEQQADLGWGALAAGGVEVIDVAGDHLSMMQEPHVQALGGALSRVLRETRWAPAGAER